MKPEPADARVEVLLAEWLERFAAVGDMIGLISLAGLFIVGALTFVPRPAMCALGGYLFGITAMPVALVAYTLGATAAFLLSRHLWRGRFLRLLQERPRWRRIVEAVDAEGWRVVALQRLGSPIPGALTNYLLGVTGIPIREFILGTLVGSVPSILIFVYLGAMGRTLAAEPSLIEAKLVFLCIGGLALLTSLSLIARRLSCGIDS